MLFVRPSLPFPPSPPLAFSTSLTLGATLQACRRAGCVPWECTQEEHPHPAEYLTHWAQGDRRYELCWQQGEPLCCTACVCVHGCIQVWHCVTSVLSSVYHQLPCIPLPLLCHCLGRCDLGAKGLPISIALYCQRAVQ